MVPIEVHVLDESERPGGLAFRVAVREPPRDGARPDGNQERTVEVRVNWADYNLWSPDGADPPERVAHATVRYLCAELARAGLPLSGLPATFDAATLRRRYPGADSAIAALLRAPRG